MFYNQTILTKLKSKMYAMISKKKQLNIINHLKYNVMV